MMRHSPSSFRAASAQTLNSPLPTEGRGVAGNHHVTGLVTLDATTSVPSS
jgi:hypothetical protein